MSLARVSLATVRGEQASGFETPQVFPDCASSPSLKEAGDATIRILNVTLKARVLKATVAPLGVRRALKVAGLICFGMSLKGIVGCSLSLSLSHEANVKPP